MRVRTKVLHLKPRRLRIAALAARCSRILTKARMIYRLMTTARGLLRTVAAIRAPCSVKAKGLYFKCWPRFKVTNCDLKEG